MSDIDTLHVRILIECVDGCKCIIECHIGKKAMDKPDVFASILYNADERLSEHGGITSWSFVPLALWR